MSDEACCACMRVKYTTFENPDGSQWGHWVCDLCGSLFLPKRLAEYQVREAVRAVEKALCVKKQEAEPMGGLEGAALEQALKEDVKDREMAQHAKKPYSPPQVHSVPNAELARPPPTGDLPAGMKMAMWLPIQQQDGTTIFQCSVDGFGLRATASSRSKQKALAYCLEDLARQLTEADHG